MRDTDFYVVGTSYLRLSMKVGENFDAIEKVIKYGRREAHLFLLSTLTSSIDVISLVESVLVSSKLTKIDEQLFNGAASKCYDYKEALRLALSGVAILFIPSYNYAIAIEVRNYPTRSISEPSSEKTIRGSKDGFTESINDDIGLIRRRVRSKDLKIELFQVGSESKTDVAMIYLEGVAKEDETAELRDRINKIDVESLVMSDRALEEKIFDQSYKPFPLVRYTERPDIASINLYNGKILLMVDTSPTVIITPTTLIDHTKSVDEYRHSPIVGSFFKFLRTFAIILSVFLIPLWLALITETDISNFFLIRPSKDVSMPIILQVLIAELFVELIRLAIVHTPNELTSTIGIVAAIILGSVSIDLEIFLPEVLVYVSFSAIASYATPSYELSSANRIIKYIMIFLSYFFGRIGFIIGVTVLFIHLSSLKCLGEYYLYPLVPLRMNRLKGAFYRKDGQGKKTL